MVSFTIEKPKTGRWILEEPALDLALPRVYRQPTRPSFRRGKTSVDQLIGRARHAHHAKNNALFGQTTGELFVEFHPALQWAMSCWEYLLSVEGCRFLPRNPLEKRYHRGNYRAFLQGDFPKLVHRSFKSTLVDFLTTQPALSFEKHVRQAFWKNTRHQYIQLEEPEDTKQRKLTALSYLRCVPYEFLNDHHQNRLTSALSILTTTEHQLIATYFLRFYRIKVAADQIGLSASALQKKKTQALKRLRRHDPIVSALLLQIERY